MIDRDEVLKKIRDAIRALDGDLTVYVPKDVDDRIVMDVDDVGDVALAQLASRIGAVEHMEREIIDLQQQLDVPDDVVIVKLHYTVAEGMSKMHGGGDAWREALKCGIRQRQERLDGTSSVGS